MQCSVVLQFFDDDAQTPARTVELVQLHRSDDQPDAQDVGLTLDEGKAVLTGLQQELVGEQLARFCSAHQCCVVCGAQRRVP